MLPLKCLCCLHSQSDGSSVGSFSTWVCGCVLSWRGTAACYRAFCQRRHPLQCLWQHVTVAGRSMAPAVWRWLGCIGRLLCGREGWSSGHACGHCHHLRVKRVSAKQKRGHRGRHNCYSCEVIDHAQALWARRRGMRMSLLKRKGKDHWIDLWKKVKYL